jgi:Type I restriction modification DNA specificity domain.
MTLIPLSDLFEVTYGVNLELNKMKCSDNGIPFVGRSDRNNGVTALVEPIDGINPNPAGSISVAGGGSVLATFLQQNDYYSGRDLFYLMPKMDMNDSVKLYYCACIRANKYRYNYGRQANKTLKSIFLPSMDDVPEWVLGGIQRGIRDVANKLNLL